MKILIATEVIYPGGAETFTLRLANALKNDGHDVTVFAFYKEHYHELIHKSLAPDMQVLWPSIPANKLLRKIDSLLFKLRIDYRLRGVYIKRSLRKVISEINPDILHSHLLKVDTICTAVVEEYNLPVVSTIHGDYLQFYTKLTTGISIPLLNYKKKAKKNLATLKAVVCISDKQIAFFNSQFAAETENKLTKIYNGYEGDKPVKSKNILRESLGIGTDDFVFGIISRGIPEKGWETAVLAFIKLNNPRTHLILIGDSPYLKTLASNYINNKQVHFVGQSYEPLEWINTFDAGLLPSTYGSESLPTVIIEYLYCGKPVIASDAGEIKNMITHEGRSAGIIIPVKNNKVGINELVGSMDKMITDKAYYNTLKENAAFCFAQFDMSKCITKYLGVYNKAIAKK